jgi:hypothetical protein
MGADLRVGVEPLGQRTIFLREIFRPSFGFDNPVEYSNDGDNTNPDKD